MATLAELLAQKAELERRIAEQSRAEREQAIAQVRQLMTQHGLTLADVGGSTRPQPPRGSRGPTTAGPAAKVAPKYRHPETGQTWSGRGLQPNWLKAALAGGRSLSDFAV
ncbi:MAG: H-NS family nucleoid-associated regulatory protein [Pseudomonadota bacterium]|jgi:DNA-binding protein H-NS|nr:H-NS histone family protein [Burkholderiaceae bacterium]